MDIKQGKEKTELVKEEGQETEKYIFQKNTKTKVGFTTIIITLIVLILAIVISFYFFKAPGA